MQDDSPRRPRWLELSDGLAWPLVGMAMTTALESPKRNGFDTDVSGAGYEAIVHHAGCVETANLANRNGRHSVAVSLLRQSVEALTVFEIALQSRNFGDPHLRAWKAGKKSHGELRRALEREIWPRYGTGLWDEPWAEFCGNLAQAVQPYAHYTTELAGWLMQTIAHDGGAQLVVTVGLETYDALLASRITLLQSVLTWMLGRMLLIHGMNPDVLVREGQLDELRGYLGRSKLLFERGAWGAQLAPHMIFGSGIDWRDDE